jgi:hypothetical protein
MLKSRGLEQRPNFMSTKSIVVVTGVGGHTLAELIHKDLATTRPRALGIASAFVSVAGIREAIEMVRRNGRPKCRIVAGISSAITHPEALYEAMDSGWDLKLGESTRGIFHPKIIVAGERFDRTGNVVDPCFSYLGSGNLTYAGLKKNIECSLLSSGSGCPNDASNAFAKLWHRGTSASSKRLAAYSKEFAERNRRRPVEALIALGVDDSARRPRSYKNLHGEFPPPECPAVSHVVARSAWAGLESFTGEYRFQLEFPRAAGEVLRELIARRHGMEGSVPIYCSGDAKVRTMQYAYYTDNSMFRLNIPNDVPGIQKARVRHNGIALVDASARRNAILELTILPPGQRADQVVARSIALGTWGRTPTRPYGWY